MNIPSQSIPLLLFLAILGSHPLAVAVTFSESANAAYGVTRSTASLSANVYEATASNINFNSGSSLQIDLTSMLAVVSTTASATLSGVTFTSSSLWILGPTPTAATGGSRPTITISVTSCTFSETYVVMHSIGLGFLWSITFTNNVFTRTTSDISYPLPLVTGRAELDGASSINVFIIVTYLDLAESSSVSFTGNSFTHNRNIPIGMGFWGCTDGVASSFRIAPTSSLTFSSNSWNMVATNLRIHNYQFKAVWITGGTLLIANETGSTFSTLYTVGLLFTGATLFEAGATVTVSGSNWGLNSAHCYFLLSQGLVVVTGQDTKFQFLQNAVNTSSDGGDGVAIFFGLGFAISTNATMLLSDNIFNVTAPGASSFIVLTWISHSMNSSAYWIDSGGRYTMNANQATAYAYLGPTHSIETGATFQLVRPTIIATCDVGAAVGYQVGGVSTIFGGASLLFDSGSYSFSSFGGRAFLFTGAVYVDEGATFTVQNIVATVMSLSAVNSLFLLFSAAASFAGDRTTLSLSGIHGTIASVVPTMVTVLYAADSLNVTGGARVFLNNSVWNLTTPATVAGQMACFMYVQSSTNITGPLSGIVVSYVTSSMTTVSSNAVFFRSPTLLLTNGGSLNISSSTISLTTAGFASVAWITTWFSVTQGATLYIADATVAAGASQINLFSLASVSVAGGSRLWIRNFTVNATTTSNTGTYARGLYFPSTTTLSASSLTWELSRVHGISSQVIQWVVFGSALTSGDGSTFLLHGNNFNSYTGDSNDEIVAHGGTISLLQSSSYILKGNSITQRGGYAVITSMGSAGAPIVASSGSQFLIDDNRFDVSTTLTAIMFWVSGISLSNGSRYSITNSDLLFSSANGLILATSVGSQTWAFATESTLEMANLTVNGSESNLILVASANVFLTGGSSWIVRDSTLTFSSMSATSFNVLNFFSNPSFPHRSQPDALSPSSGDQPMALDREHVGSLLFLLRHWWKLHPERRVVCQL
jgi:hypothetical protein